jgi:hypothetical protein
MKMSSKQIYAAISNDRKLRTIFGGIVLDIAILMSIIVMAAVTYL